jgi:hypothetical protein
MTFPEEDLPDVDAAAHAVVREAKNAGAWVLGGGLKGREEACIVPDDRAVIEGPNPDKKDFIGGFAIVDVPSRAEALEWAAKFAVACRCAQEVREILFDPAT